MGVNPVAPSNFIIDNRDPGPSDYAEYNVGDEWENEITLAVWKLVSKGSESAPYVATWVQLTGGSGSTTDFKGDSGTAVPSGGIINITGDGVSVATLASGNTVQVKLNNSISVVNLTVFNNLTVGGMLTFLGLTQGVVISSSGGVLSSTEGTTGQILRTASTGVPTWATLAAGSGISLTNVDNTITITNTGGGGGGGTTQFNTDSGSATPASGIITMHGDGNITTSGTGSTVTYHLASTLTGITNLTVNNLTVTNTTTLSGLSTGVLESIGGVVTSSIGTNGQVLQSFGSTPVWATLVAGANITLTNISGSITIAASASGGGGPGGVSSWIFETSSATMASNFGYVSNSASLITLTLPSTMPSGTVLRVKGMGTGGWKIAQNAGQQIVWDATDATTVGTGGSLASTDQYDAIELLCIVANTTFSVLSSMGNITIV
jgi:hypothetical protein